MIRELRSVVLMGAGSVLLACSGDTVNGPPVHDIATAYWALQLNQHAIALALTTPYNTIQLTATPVSPAGSALTVPGVISYRATDSTVTVDARGRVTAHYVTHNFPAYVIASLQDTTQGVTHVDTAFIQVTDTAPHVPLATLSITPGLGDSTKRSVDFYAYRLPIMMTDAAGRTVCDTILCSLPVYYSVSNPAVARIDKQTGVAEGGSFVDTGHTTFTASTWAYGVAKTSTIPFTVGNPLYALYAQSGIQAADTLTGLGFYFFGPQIHDIGIGGIVYFSVNTRRTGASIHFDGPALVDSGTVPPLYSQGHPSNGAGDIGPFQCQEDPTATMCSRFEGRVYPRRFSVPGTYHFSSPQVPGYIGTINVFH